MKFSGMLLFLSCSLLAESPFEQEMNQLGEQREKDISSAVEPIDRRYKEALEALMRRATQASDLDAALKIRKLLGQLPPTASTPGAAAPAKPAAEANPSKVELTKKGLEMRLEKTTWETPTNNWLRRFTIEKGRVIINPNEKGQGKGAAYRVVDGLTIEYEWDHMPCLVTFSPDLTSCKRGTLPYKRK